MLTAPQQIKDRLQAASERRTELHDQLVEGLITVDVYRDRMAAEDRWIDTLLGRLSTALADATV